MQASAIPTKFQKVWGASAGGSYIRTVPVSSQIGTTNGAASFTDGFPPDCFSPVSAGGVPPFGQDFNGILQAITSWNQWQQLGGAVPYDGTFQSEVGGYPKGAIVSSLANIGSFWISSVDNNTTDPDTGGAGWLQFPIHGRQTFTSSGTFTVPFGVNSIEVFCTGGGGGGANCNGSFPPTSSVDASGGGGGAGGTAIGSYAVTPGQSIAVTVGAFGGSQNNGGTSSFGSFCSAGGGAGSSFVSSGISPGGGGGSASGGQINIIGGYGGDGQDAAVAFPGNGGASYWGGGVRAFSATASAPPAAAYGSGGGGAYNGTHGGASGAAGIVVIEY